MTAKKHKMRDGIVNRSTTTTPSYAFLVRVGGKAKWHSGYRTKKEAMAARDEMRNAVRQGTYVERTRQTLGEWLTEWVATYNRGNRESTRDSYARVLRLYVLTHSVADVKLQNLSAAMLVRHWSQVRESGGQGGKPLSARTVRYAHTVVVKALNQAVTDKLIPDNPAAKVGRELGKGASRDVAAWPHDVLASFLATTQQDRLHSLWVVLAHTGMRRGEALALRWEDVDLDAGSVRIARAVADTGSGAVYGGTKTDEARTVPLNASARSALRAWRAQQNEERMRNRLVWTTDKAAGDLVFTWEDGRHVAGSYVSKAFAKSVKAAELPALSLHGLRHTFATHLLRERVPVHTVSKLLGHASPVMTLNIYAHVIPGDDSAATDALDRLVNGG
jgi:integrase